MNIKNRTSRKETQGQHKKDYDISMSFSRRIFLPEEITQQKPLPYQKIIAAKHYHKAKSTIAGGFKKIY